MQMLTNHRLLTQYHRLAPRPRLARHPPIQRSRRSFLLAVGASSGVPEELKLALDDLIASNKVVVFMKGTKQFPQCGFSHTVVQILNTMNAQFAAVNILENEIVRQGMKEYSQWPTFPQVYIDGEFYGGCDIMIDAFQSGTLQETLEKSQNS